MAAVPSLSRALRPSLPQSTSSGYICQACRHQSSYRRTRKALRVKPDASFLPSRTETQDHIIFNPPSSAPSVYHTPTKFLPPDDPRRRLHTLAAKPSTIPTITPDAPSALQSVSAAVAAARTLPAVRPINEKKYHLQEHQIREIRRLRAEDPRTWTRYRLAEKFDCSQFFVSLCCTSPEMAREQQKALDEVKKRWGQRRTEAREARQERKKLWGRDA